MKPVCVIKSIQLRNFGSKETAIIYDGTSCVPLNIAASNRTRTEIGRRDQTIVEQLYKAPSSQTWRTKYKRGTEEGKEVPPDTGILPRKQAQL